MGSDNERDFSSVIRRLLKEGDWHRFDLFFIRFMGYEWEGSEPEEELRREAYHAFLEQAGEERCASLPTIRRWFGIGGFRIPTREQIYQICFSLQVPTAVAEQFLKEGIGEPSFQISDYHEMIAMYVLENRLGTKKYERLLKEYERKIAYLGEDIPAYGSDFNTRWLFRQFASIKSIPEQDFLCWMWEHADLFKGYSKTVQDYLMRYRKKVIEYIRQEVEERLKLLLSETGYPEWKKKKRGAAKNEGARIKQYLAADTRRKNPAVSEGLRKNILELTNIVYSERGLNSQMIAELFEPWDIARTGRHGIVSRQTIKVMSGKYASDLFNIPARNELGLKVRKAVSRLEQMDGADTLPEDLAELVCDCTGEEISEVAAARESLGEFERENKRRRLLVRRSDLLPLIFYVSQQTYLCGRREDNSTYQAEAAKKIFINRANATLLACNMEPLNPHYLFDAILLACFQEDEMYTYADVLTLI